MSLERVKRIIKGWLIVIACVLAFPILWLVVTLNNLILMIPW